MAVWKFWQTLFFINLYRIYIIVYYIICKKNFIMYHFNKYGKCFEVFDWIKYESGHWRYSFLTMKKLVG